MLRNVSFSIKEGQIVSLIGLNGTGKSTLLKAIVGQIKPSKGTIKSSAEKIFYIPQTSDLNNSFPLVVKEFCELFGAKTYPKYLKDLEVEDKLKQTIASLSGGELQRVLIAIALSHQPELLLLDEITAGVDVKGEESFYKLISQIRDQYKTAIVIVSHNIHLVIKNADSAICLAGHICCTGKPHEIQDNAAIKEIFGDHLLPYIHKHDHVH